MIYQPLYNFKSWKPKAVQDLSSANSSGISFFNCQWFHMGPRCTTLARNFLYQIKWILMAIQIEIMNTYLITTPELVGISSFKIKNAKVKYIITKILILYLQNSQKLVLAPTIFP